MVWIFKRQKEYDEDIEKGSKKMLHLTMLRILGIYPDLYKKYCWSVAHILLIYSVLVGAIYGLFLAVMYAGQFMEVELMSQKIFLLCYFMFYTFALNNLHKNRDAFDSLLKIMGQEFFEYSTPLSEKQIQIMQSDANSFQYFTKIYILIMTPSTLYISTAVAIIKVSSSGKFSTITNGSVPFNTNLPLGLAYPVDTSTLGTFLPMYLFEACVHTYIGNLLLFEDVTTGNFIAHLSRQIMILTQSINEIYDRAMLKYHGNKKQNMYEVSEFQECLFQVFTENIKHYQTIIKYQKVLQRMVNQLFLILFIGSGFTICFSGYLTKNVDVSAPGGISHLLLSLIYLVHNLIVIYFYCWFSEKLSITSEEYAVALYNTPWPYCGKKFKQVLQLTILFTQTQDFRLTASRIATFSLDTFGEILKKSYSYLNVLSATSN